MAKGSSRRPSGSLSLPGARGSRNKITRPGRSLSTPGNIAKNLYETSVKARNKSAPDHNHDELYYNRSKVDLLFADMKTDIETGVLRDTGNYIAAFDPGEVGESMIPDTHNVYDLGSNALMWKDLYLAGNIYVGDNKSITFVDPDNGQIYMNSAGGLNTINLKAEKIMMKGNLAMDIGKTISLGGQAITTWGDVATIATIDDIPDVNSAGAVNNNVLVFDGNTWDASNSISLQSGYAVNLSADWVKVWRGFELDNGFVLETDQLSDITNSNLNNPVLKWDSSDSHMKWFEAQAYDFRPPFTELTDTPNSLIGHGDKYLKITNTGSAIEFVDFPTHTISTSTDVNTTGANNNDVLVYTNGTWLDSSSVNLDDITGVNGTFTDMAISTTLDIGGTGYGLANLTAGQPGEVLRKATLGSDLEWIHMPTDLGDLSDVTDEAYNNNEILQYNSGTSKFQATKDVDDLDSVTATTGIIDTLQLNTAFKWPSGAGTVQINVPDTTPNQHDILRITNATGPYELDWAVNSLDALSDTNLTNPASHAILKYNGTDWIDSLTVNLDTVSANTVEASEYLTIDNTTFKVSTTGSGSNGDFLTQGDDNGTRVLNWTTFNTGNWDTAYTHSQSAHAPANAEANVKSDWNENDPADDSYIQNKPTLVTNFDGLSQTPNSMSNEAGKYLVVNAGGTALEYTSSTNNAWNHQMTQDITQDGSGPYDIGTTTSPLGTIYCDDLETSTNSIQMGDEHKISVGGGSIKFLKRKTDVVPSVVASLGGTSNGALTSAGVGTLAELSRADWVDYAQTLAGGGSSTVKTIWPVEGAAGYSANDYETISGSGVEGTMTSHVIPDSNAAYDLGNAEYKIRHLFLSDNSLWVGDDHKITIEGGKQKFKKRNKSVVPAKITALGGDATGAKTHSGEATVEAIKLHQWLAYGISLDAGTTLEDIYPPEGGAGYTKDDYEEIFTPQQSGHNVQTPITGAAAVTVDLMLSKRAVINNPTGDFSVAVEGANATEGCTFKAKIIAINKANANTLDTAAVTINGTSCHTTIVNAPSIAQYSMVIYEMECAFVDGFWFANVTANAGTQNSAYQQQQNNPQ